MRFSIERCTSDGVHGWVADETGLPVSISISVDGSEVNVPIERYARDDLRGHFDPKAIENGGFHFSLGGHTESRRQRINLVFCNSTDRAEFTAELPGELPHFSLRWLKDTSPFPPEIMTAIEATDPSISWGEGSFWTAEAVAQATEVLLFLLDRAGRRTAGLFRYFSFLSQTAKHFSLLWSNFPLAYDVPGLGIATGPQELFLISHHLFVLKEYGVSGPLVEFGCFKGFSTSCLSFTCHLLNRRMHVFDSFSGLPLNSSKFYELGQFAGDRNEVERNVREFGRSDVVTYHQGYFCDTVPHAKLGHIGCIWMDVDLESSSVDAMKLLPYLDRRSAVFSHESQTDAFNNHGALTQLRTPENVFPPIFDAFNADGRAPAGRHLITATGVVWDAENSIPPPAACMTKLFDRALKN